MALLNKIPRLLQYLAFLFLLFSTVIWILMSGNLSVSIQPLIKIFLMIYDTFVIFISRVLELFPFLFLGTFTSGIIAVLVSEEDLLKFIPKSITKRLLLSVSLGLFFPGGAIACVPISARLLKKGAPLSVVIPFLFFSPILNLVVLGKLGGKYGLFSQNLLLTLVLPFLISLLSFLILKMRIKKRENEDATQKNHLIFEHSGLDDLNFLKCKPLVKIISISLLEFLYFGKYLFTGAFVTALLNPFFLAISEQLVKIIGFPGLSTISSIFFSHHPVIQVNYLENSFPGIERAFQVVFFYIGSFINIPNLFLLFGLSEMVFARGMNDWKISQKRITLQNSILFSLLGIYQVYAILGNELNDFLFPGFVLFAFLSSVNFVVFAQINFRYASKAKIFNQIGEFPISIKEGQRWIALFLMILIFTLSSNFHIH